jgi:hypothetical protein
LCLSTFESNVGHNWIEEIKNSEKSGYPKTAQYLLSQLPYQNNFEQLALEFESLGFLQLAHLFFERIALDGKK